MIATHIEMGPVTEADPLGSRSLSTALRQEIESMILGGSIPAGKRLNESSLAQKFRVSRGPVREAFRSLVEAGLLEFIPHRGVFIREMSVADAVDSYEVRAGLFGLAGRLAAARIQPAEVAVLRSLVDRMDEHIRAGNGQGYYELNLELHARILRATGNKRLVATYQNLVNELQLLRAMNIKLPDHMAASNAEHRTMVEALAAGDEDRAFEAHFRHVMEAKERVVQVMGETDTSRRE
jgi:DNA-binding GntR family transcriptional regulator